MLLPIVLYIVVPLCLKMQYLSHMEAVLCSKKGQMSIYELSSCANIEDFISSQILIASALF